MVALKRSAQPITVAFQFRAQLRLPGRAISPPAPLSVGNTYSTNELDFLPSSEKSRGAISTKM